MTNSSGTHHRHKKSLEKMSKQEKRIEFMRQERKKAKKKGR